MVCVCVCVIEEDEPIKGEQRGVMRFGWSGAVINATLGSTTGHTFGSGRLEKHKRLLSILLPSKKITWFLFSQWLCLTFCLLIILSLLRLSLFHSFTCIMYFCTFSLLQLSFICRPFLLTCLLHHLLHFILIFISPLPFLFLLMIALCTCTFLVLFSPLLFSFSHDADL